MSYKISWSKHKFIISKALLVLTSGELVVLTNWKKSSREDVASPSSENFSKATAGLVAMLRSRVLR